MRLYHFTSVSHIQSILRTGLTRGELVLDGSNRLNAVNLTSDKSPAGHGLSSGRFATKGELERRGWTLTDRAPVPVFANKRRVRITVKVDRQMVTRWHRWARRSISQHLFDAVVQTGGGMKKARTWYFHDGPIDPGRFETVEFFNRGTWVSSDQYEGPWHEEFSLQALDAAYAEWGFRLRSGLCPEYLRQVDAYLDHLNDLALEAWENENEEEAQKYACPSSRRTKEELQAMLGSNSRATTDHAALDAMSGISTHDMCLTSPTSPVNTSMAEQGAFDA